MTANSIHAAPAGLAKTISAVALAKGAAVSGSTLTLVKGALKIMAWTKAKTAIVAVAAAIVAASTATMVVSRVIQTRTDDPNIADSFFYSTNVWRAPGNVLVFRRTHFTGAGGAMTTSRQPFRGKDEERMMGRNQSIAQIFEMAYWMPETETRIVVPNDLPQANFDYLITLPTSQEDQLKAFQAAIKTKLGLVAHFETRETDALLLKPITPGVIDLKPHPDNEHFAGVTTTGGQIHAVGQTTKFLANVVEGALKLPVLDQTGLAGKRYDYDLSEDLFRGTNDSADVKKFLRDEFGLEVVSSREPVKMLVVEKAK